jgi:prevent-host-death family protein
MLTVSASEFRRRFGHFRDQARAQPVAVTDGGKDAVVVLSSDEYRRLKRRDRVVLGLDDFDESDIALLEAARAPEATKAFDSEPPS